MVKKLLLLVAIVFITSKSFAQSETYLRELRVLKSYGYTIGDEEKVNCVEGGTGYYYHTFSKGLTYIIVGCSDDENVSDVDLFLYDLDGNELKRDTDVSNLAMLSFVPNYDVRLKVVIMNYKSSTPDFASTCRFVVAFK